MPNLRIAYAGTPDFSVPALQALADSPHTIVAVITQPDRRAGRGKKFTFSPVKTAALEKGLPLLQPENINQPEVLTELEAMQLDMLVVAAYGQIFSEQLLSLPKYGCINIHASYLPRWRGASPIQHAILTGDQHTGVSIMQMHKAMDAGDVWLQSRCEITDQDSAQLLHDRLAKMASVAIIDALPVITDSTQTAAVQEEAKVTYCKKIKKEDGLIDWSNTATVILRKLRAFDPWPGVFTYFDERRIRIVNATEEILQQESEPGRVLAADGSGILVACGENAVRITELTPAGGKCMHAKDFANSNAVVHSRLGAE